MRTMWISVWHSDMFGRNDFLGEVMMPMAGQVFDDPSAKWYSLQDSVGSILRSEILNLARKLHFINIQIIKITPNWLLEGYFPDLNLRFYFFEDAFSFRIKMDIKISHEYYTKRLSVKAYTSQHTADYVLPQHPTFAISEIT